MSCVSVTRRNSLARDARCSREFEARGIQWAPHKKRGPCCCIEFLGLLLCNTPAASGITLTEKRLGRMLAEMEAWEARRPTEGELEVDPTELASLLGKLVFAPRKW